MIIKKAKTTDAKKLTELTIRSKSYWDYSAAQIEEWKAVLTVSSVYIDQNEVYNLVEESQIVGYYSFFNKDSKTIKLDNIFLEPKFIGKGYGKQLMNHFINQVKSKGFEKIVLDSDPNAEAFYLKFGFKVIGQLETSIKNRTLPLMELKIGNTK